MSGVSFVRDLNIPKKADIKKEMWYHNRRTSKEGKKMSTTKYDEDFKKIFGLSSERVPRLIFAAHLFSDT